MSPAPALTEEQEPAAARRGEPLALSAAAGSGKTSVLVERFVRAVLQDGIAPGRILAITFTERAAGELRERVRARLLELGRRDAARDTEAAFVGTFHGFCARLLRAHPLAAELDPAFTILDEGRAGRLREQAFALAARAFLEGSDGPAVDLLAAYRFDRAARIVLGLHGELRSTGQRRPALTAPAIEEGDEKGLEAARTLALFDRLLGCFSDAYEELKQLRGALDFDDLELAAGALLAERELIRSSWSERFELLMVDEFQDTNPRQLAILAALDRGNLFTVGDEFQAIYGFRHADVGLFRARRRDLEPSGRSLSLTRNFRSRPAVLGVVNEIFGERFEGFSGLLPGRPEETGAAGPAVELLLNDSEGWDEPESARAVSEGLGGRAPLWRRAEARMMAARIAELVRRGEARAGEVVILLRATGDLDLFERALALEGLRTLAAVGAFWGQQQIVDLLAYLRVLANPLDELALHSALASPLAGCSLDGLALLAADARGHGGGLWEALERAAAGAGEGEPELGAADRAAVARFRALVAGERARLGRRTISQLIDRVIEHSGYREHVLGLEWGERRIANIHKLLRLARRHEAAEGRDLRGFLEQVAYLQGAAAIEPDAPVEGVEPDAVRLMTIHAAKGLEFPVVCVADMGRGPNNQTADVLVEGERVGLRLVRLDGGESERTLELEQLMEERRDREAGEEDRILYVAMTRARERLLLCGSGKFSSWPRATASPIAWVVPRLDPDLPELLAADAAPPVLHVGPGALEVRLQVNRPGRSGTPDAGRAAPSDPGPGSREAVVADHPNAPVPPRPGAREPRSAPAGRRELAPVGSLSYSSLSQFERCGYRFYLERVLGLPEDRAAAAGAEQQPGLDPRSRGTLVHSLMETLDFRTGTPAGPAVVEARAAELGLRVSPHEAEELAGLLEGAAGAPLAARIAAGRPVGREYPFALALGPGEPLLGGFIDLLAAEGEQGRLVVDYKSDRVGPGEDLEELTERDYGVQRELYALAALRGGAGRVEVVHWFLARPEEPVGVHFDRGALGELEGRLGELVRRARAGHYEVSERPHRGLCLTCPGRRSLCSWGEAQTLRADPPPPGGPAEEPPGTPLRLF